MADPATQTHRGSCLCGAVAYEVEGPLRPVIVCHCRLCRAWSGHVFAATSAPLSHFRLTRQKGLAWYRSSPAARRGFCGACGASLFWKPDGEERMSFAAGSLDGVTGLAVIQHLLPEEAGDYYSPEGPPPPAAEVRGRAAASCICGACRFSLPLPLGPATACHCSQCRKLSGHYAASFDVAEAAVDWLARETLRTCRTPGGAERGFCGACGSSLWFRAPDGSFSVEGGCVEGATGGRLAGHIFTAGKGDYYAIDDGLPQTPGA
ncbi:GFA family protein [Solirhodobacter olei]|uniref:GFA family protein n=1 Tax=Solirhodobacter olei TaxID=2493082 RepID=UPI001F4DAC09|nr:GFA family protein [Solirhodobacter olei]